MKNPWIRFAFDAWSLGLEASSVIGLRTLKIAAGGLAAEAETRLMFMEKVESGWALQGKAMTGGLGLNAYAATTRTLAHYRRKVRCTAAFDVNTTEDAVRAPAKAPNMGR
jgi:hypothetical protein